MFFLSENKYMTNAGNLDLHHSYLLTEIKTNYFMKNCDLAC
jgi:hypothetical protein